jgi:hypothetical protein
MDLVDFTENTTFIFIFWQVYRAGIPADAVESSREVAFSHKR